MRTKSKYREIKSENIPVEESPTENIPEIELNGVEAEPIVAASVETSPEVEPDSVDHAVEVAAKADAASLALKRQIEALHQAEELQRQHQAAMTTSQQPMSREQKIEIWKTQGLTEGEANFLREHPVMVDHPQIASHAAAEAMQAGIERDTEPYWKAVEEGFDRHMAQLKAQATAQPTPDFFKPPPPKPPRAPPSIVSAPVSREVPSGIPRELNPSQIKLTAEQVEHARVAGISPVEYARQLQRLQREKAAGLRQNG